MRYDLDFAPRPTPTNSHLQVAAIPVRWIGNGPQILLVTTRGKGRWTTPKGWPLTETPNAACAAREAFEEAGVTGRVWPYALGEFEYEKKADGAKLALRATAFLLDVEETHETWPEHKTRKRDWFSLTEAKRLVENSELAQLMEEAVLRSKRRRRKSGARAHGAVALTPVGLLQ
jgi:8-oxo-dGTP pyrophosphatase MutT (NUDIX family)